MKDTEPREPETFSEYMGRWSDRIEKLYEWFYSEGYARGKKDVLDSLEKSKDCIAYIDVATEEEREKNYCTEEELTGWCSVCKRPLTGRWAAHAGFCPWCGRKIARLRFKNGEDDGEED